MAGLSGIAAGERCFDLGGELQRMLAAQKDLPWHRAEAFLADAGDLAVGRVSLDILPSPPLGPTRFLHGEESDGFVEVLADPATRRLTLRNDAFGMMPLFYCHIGGRLLFATDVKALLAHPALQARLDERGLADLLAFGFVLGEKTLIRGVRALPAGSRLVFDGASGELTVERGAGLRPLLGRSGRAHPDAGSRIEAAFLRAIDARCAGGLQIGVSLSGGLDSRTIMAAIDHHEHRIRTLTVDVAGGADRAIAERIARRTNGLANHRVVENAADFFARWPAYVREMVWLTDGMFYDEACVMMPTLDLYREAGMEVVLRGHGGELARMHEAYELRVNRHVRACASQAALKAQLFRQLNFGLRGEQVGSLLVPELAASLRGAAAASLEEAFAGIDPHWHVIDQVSCLYAEQYLPRQCVPSLAQLRSRAEVRLPFLDRDYVEAVLGLPPEDRITSITHRRLLRRTNAALLWITNANTLTWAGAPELVQRVSRKGFQLLSQAFGYEPYRHYVDPAGWLRGPLHEPVRAILLDPAAASGGFFVPAAVRELLEAHRSGRADHSAQLLQLAYVELWRRIFLEREGVTR